MSYSRGQLVIFIAATVISATFIINLCATIYQCGCTFVWAGANAQCNIHAHGAKHCPWCVIGNAGFAVVLGVILASQAAISFCRAAWSWPVRLGLTLLAFPVVGSIEAVLVGVWQGYWV